MVNLVDSQVTSAGRLRAKANATKSADIMLSLGSDMRRRLGDSQERRGAWETTQSYRRLMAVLEASADCVLFGDSSGCITSVNATACRLLGSSREQLLATPWDSIYAPQQRKKMLRILTSVIGRNRTWRGNVAIVANDGAVIETTQVITAHTDDTGTTGYFSMVARDMSEQLALQERIRNFQQYDALTGLPALSQVNQVVRHLIAQRCGGRGSVALVSVNLDEFRLVDEGFGREVGDEVLKGTGLLLRDAVQKADVVARIFADEFLVVIPGPPDGAGVAQAVQGLLELIAAPRLVAGQTLRMTASAGIAKFPTDARDFGGLLGRSHAAMCVAKKKAHGGFQFYSGNAEQSARRRLTLETDLRNAIEQKQLTLSYQPQYEIRDGSVSGVEALARWSTSCGNPIAPAVFIPLAEQSGLIGALGSWALQEACATAASWRNSDNRPLTICVNVSSLQLGPEFVGTVSRALEAANCPAGRLELELTESALLVDAKLAIDCLSQLKEFGVRIALDDFGTGYSSLSYLSRLPVDRLKVDQTLIQHIAADSKTAAIVRSIITLGKDLGLLVIAEGVETAMQLDVLEQMGCDQAQGYLLSRPLSLKEAHSSIMSPWNRQSQPKHSLKSASEENIHAA